MFKETTPVPNGLFDMHLASLKEAELKTFLVIVRQTLGWKDKRTGGRKVRDRITGFQFIKKTGMSKRAITTALQSLLLKRLIDITDFYGNVLTSPLQRKGKTYLYYAVQISALGSATNIPAPEQKANHNKTNYERKINSKESHGVRHISEIGFAKFLQALP